MRRVYPVLIPTLIVVAVGMLCLAAKSPNGTNARLIAASPTSEAVAVREEVTRIVPWPITVEVVTVIVATETPAPRALTATVKARTPQPTRPAYQSPTATRTATPPHMTGSTDGQSDVGDG